MADLREQPRPVSVAPETTIEELAEALQLLNAEAKRLSRSGKTATLTDVYAAWHERLNAVLMDYEACRDSSA